MDNLTDRKQFETWLKTQPREVCVAIASRAALRALPAIAASRTNFSRIFPGGGPQFGFMNRGEEISPRIFLPVIRAMALALTAATYPARSDKLRGVAADAYFAATSAAPDYPANAIPKVAAFASRAIYADAATDSAAAELIAGAVTESFIVFGSGAFQGNAFEANAFDTGAFASQAASQDAQFIIDGGAADELATRPLWLDAIPPGARALWNRLRVELLRGEEDWDVWTRWYEAVLEGNPTPGGEELDIFRVTLDNEEDWQRGPAHVNALIKAKEEEIARGERGSHPRRFGESMPDLRNQKEVEEWLSNKSENFSISLSLRSALRVFPLVRLAFVNLPVEAKSDWAPRVFGSVLHALAFSWVVSAYPEGATEFKVSEDAAQAAEDAGKPIARDARAIVFAIAYAAFAAARNNVPYTASIAITDVFNFDPNLKTYAFETALVEDVNSLTPNRRPSGRSNFEVRAIWNGQQAAYVSDLWREIRSWMLSRNEDWDVWTRWYEARLEGRPSPGGEELDIFRVTLPEELWEQGPKAVNAAIKAKEEEIAGRFAPHFDDVDLSQRPSGYVFDLKDGKLTASAVFGRVTDATIAEDIRQELIEKLRGAANRLEHTQGPKRYIDTMNRAADLLASHHALELPLGKLLMASRSLETDAAAVSSPEGRQEFAPDVIAMMDDFVQSFDDFKSLFPEIIKIESARLALQLATADADEANLQAVQIVETMRNAPIVAKSAQDALDEPAEEIDRQRQIIATSSNDAEVAKAIEVKASIVAQRVMGIRNAVARSLKALGTRTAMAAGKGYDKAVEDVVSGGVKAGITMLVSSIAGPLAGLAMFVASLRPFAKRAEEIRDSNPPGDMGEA